MKLKPLLSELDLIEIDPMAEDFYRLKVKEIYIHEGGREVKLRLQDVDFDLIPLMKRLLVWYEEPQC